MLLGHMMIRFPRGTTVSQDAIASAAATVAVFVIVGLSIACQCLAFSTLL